MAKTFAFIETILGLLAAFVLGIAPPVGSLLFGISQLLEGSPAAGGGLILMGILGLRSSILVISLASRWEREVLRDRSPPPVDAGESALFGFEDIVPERDRRTLIGFMASNLPTYAWPYRVWCAMYWAALLTASAWLGHQLCRGAAHAVNNDSTILFAFACVGHFAFLVSTNLYLVLAAAIILPESNDWLMFYRARLLIDAAAISISVAAVFLI